MMKKIVIGLVISVFILTFFNYAKAENNLSEKLNGRILLQVEQNGEAYYLYPGDLKRYYLGSPKDAWDIMRFLGVGISNTDLQKIPTGIDARMNIVDSDNDGLSDDLEKIFGTHIYLPDTDHDGFSDSMEILNNYCPLNGNGYRLPIDLDFTEKQKGKIFLQVESHGEAWYVNPEDGKKYYMGKPEDAFQIMRYLGLGISNDNISKITKNNSIIFNPKNLNEKYQNVDIQIKLNRSNSGTYARTDVTGHNACYKNITTSYIKSHISHIGSYITHKYGMLEFYNPLPKPAKGILRMKVAQDDNTLKFLNDDKKSIIVTVKNVTYNKLPQSYDGSCEQYSNLFTTQEAVDKEVKIVNDFVDIDVTHLLDKNNYLMQFGVLIYNARIEEADLLLEY